MKTDQINENYANFQSNFNAYSKVVFEIERRHRRPVFYLREDKVREFRYTNPNIVDYFVISCLRNVSFIKALAILVLSRLDAERNILCRSFIEHCSKTAYIYSGLSLDGVDSKTEEYIHKFFKDNNRSDNAIRPKIDLRQKDIHNRISKATSNNIEFLKEIGFITPNNDDDLHQKMYSKIYHQFTYYAHGRYSEVMDGFSEVSLKPKVFEIDDGFDMVHDIEFLEAMLDMAVKSSRIFLVGIHNALKYPLNSYLKEWAFGNALDDLLRSNSNA